MRELPQGFEGFDFGTGGDGVQGRREEILTTDLLVGSVARGIAPLSCNMVVSKVSQSVSQSVMLGGVWCMLGRVVWGVECGMCWVV